MTKMDENLRRKGPDEKKARTSFEDRLWNGSIESTVLKINFALFAK